MISAILLAAGESKRMGEPKQSLSVGGIPLIHRALNVLMESSVDEIIIVLGHEYGRIRTLIPAQDRRVRVTYNRNFKQGMGASIARGMAELSRISEAVIIMPVDLPLMAKSTVNEVISAYKSEGKNIVVPFFREWRGHPVLFSRKYFTSLAALKGDRGGSSIVESNPEDVYKLETGDEGIIMDIDTVEDLDRARKKTKDVEERERI